MKKRILSIILTLCMVVIMLPIQALATVADDSQITWLGTESEYQTTIDTIFDENGLRKVTVGWNSNNGAKNKKVGMVDKYGNFVVQPIYDKIEIDAHDPKLSDYGVTTLPYYFLGGYAQAVRDGKMGLINTKGEEVIPCQYHFVQMPAEGVSAVYKNKNDKQKYLGYWSLEQNREIVAPNKYVTNRLKALQAGTGPETLKLKPTGDYLSIHDFIGGYAMVFTEIKSDGNYMATIVDKNGMGILGKSYLVDGSAVNDGYLTYPQKGPYLSFIEPKSFADYRFTKLGGEWGSEKLATLDGSEGYATGLAGAEGILIPATFTTGVLASPGEALFFIKPAKFQIIHDKKLVLTQKDALPGYLYGGAYGVVDLSGKTVVPFTHEENQHLYYLEDVNVFLSYLGTYYSITGKKLDGSADFLFKNGYKPQTAYVFNNATKLPEYTYYYVKKSDGTKLNVTKTFNYPLDNASGTTLSDVSTGGLAWVRNPSRKWGLIDMKGNIILPFEYDEVGLTNWAEGKNGYAHVVLNSKHGIVNANGEVIVPCVYRYFETGNGSHIAIVENSSYKEGIINLQTGQILVPVEYDAAGAFAGYKQYNGDHFAMNVYYVEKDGKNILLDKNGKKVFSTTKKFMEASNGLYRFNDNSGYFDNQGRIIIPGEFERTANPELGTSYTIIVKDGKVGRISANYLDRTYSVKTYTPTRATATPSSTKLKVNGTIAATDAYLIANNNYIKLRDLAAMINSTDKNFEVSWDSKKNAITLSSGKPYTSVGGEMAKGAGSGKAANRSTSTIYVDGVPTPLTAYTIGGSNYFKLRDVMKVFDVCVGYDNATSTATLDTSRSYEPGAYEKAKQEEEAAATLAAGKDPYQAKAIYKEPFVQFQSTPAKTLYKVGEAFETAGFKAVWMNVNGNATVISSDIVFKVGSTEIYDGCKFTQAGQKTVDCYYKGEKLNYFKVSVVAEDANLLEDGTYTISIYGNYLRVVKGYLELQDTQPPEKFTVKLIKVDDGRGPLYNIMTEGGQYVMQPTTKSGAQLQLSNIPHQWRINKYSSFCTVRDYGNQKMIVNASGQKKSNGTKVIIWEGTGSAPDNAKLVFTRVD